MNDEMRGCDDNRVRRDRLTTQVTVRLGAVPAFNADARCRDTCETSAMIVAGCMLLQLVTRDSTGTDQTDVLHETRRSLPRQASRAMCRSYRRRSNTSSRRPMGAPSASTSAAPGSGKRSDAGAACSSTLARSVRTRLRLLLVSFAGWINRHQQDLIEYLVEENHILREQVKGQRLRLTDDQRRRRLATKGHRLGRQLLGRVATIVTPDTILRWHRALLPASESTEALVLS